MRTLLCTNGKSIFWYGSRQCIASLCFVYYFLRAPDFAHQIIVRDFQYTAKTLRVNESKTFKISLKNKFLSIGQILWFLHAFIAFTIARYAKSGARRKYSSMYHKFLLRELKSEIQQFLYNNIQYNTHLISIIAMHHNGLVCRNSFLLVLIMRCVGC